MVIPKKVPEKAPERELQLVTEGQLIDHKLNVILEKLEELSKLAKEE